ncbi:proline iminopeptidase-family hydrolase [Erythrobacter sp. HL-111]|uniref:proline iminopeptidase-family hydrolase n=1 Tax=Erythrobacter sp. HL-111 TaxID=1798193 RepID=UPI0006DA0E0D|nr:proline iminopeptidase-family hydrolase [Erythrobacter sp. HL-111]KPP95052.1 MAG: proline iminopeptidase [Erythrobacteraceae bacterium HL-111]SDS09681.1 L-proline amide hydrolase [Erythrobacter sp. HL-111]
MTRLALRLAAALLPLALLPPAPLAADDGLDWSAPERELRVAVEGGEVWVRVNGDLGAAAEPAIFIHGGPGGTHMTFGNLVSLSDERAVILYDQLDSGKSDRPGDPANWRVDRFVGELEAIRKALGVERWHLVGHSWGAALALEYAAAHPRHTASAVLGGTYISTPHWILGTNLLIRELPDEIGETLAACESPAPPPPTRCREATRAFYAAYNGRADRPAPSDRARAYRQRYGGKGFNEALYNAMWGPSEFRATGSLVDYDATPLLARVDGSRVLFMVGQYDEARLDTVQDFVALTEGSELAVIPGGSHAFPAERPEVTEAVLRDWLARIDRRDGDARREQGQ